LRLLADKKFRIYLMISGAGKLVMSEELGIEFSTDPEKIQDQLKENLLKCPDYNQLQYLESNDLMAEIASGSVKTEAMLVVPCSMGSLARIAQGISGNLIERTADITLKERRPLIIAPRETPLNQIHLENMLKLARVGACIVPCMPAFYHQPQSIGDLVDFVVGRMLDVLGLEHHLYAAWRGHV
jgi:4-hydroxy-3-polyprenylbenzoate decarboxylase